MPRVAIKKKEYMISDLSKWILWKMYEKKVRQHEMADLLGVTQQAFSKKLKESRFQYGELLSIIKKLNATDEEILKLMKL